MLQGKVWKPLSQIQSWNLDSCDSKTHIRLLQAGNNTEKAALKILFHKVKLHPK